jgi:hypothetical protein
MPFRRTGYHLLSDDSQSDHPKLELSNLHLRPHSKTAWIATLIAYTLLVVTVTVFVEEALLHSKNNGRDSFETGFQTDLGK